MRLIYLAGLLVCSKASEGEYYTTAEEFWGDDDALALRSPRIMQTWLWGADVPPSSDGFDFLDLTDKYPDHGFIQLSSRGGESLSIDLIKRPPPSFFPVDGSFCAQLLPVAISLFFGENSWDVERLTEITVTINSRYSYSSACSCYTRVMMEMGFTNINGADMDDRYKEEICEAIRPLHLIAVPKPGDTPHLSNRSRNFDAILLLQSAPYITSTVRE